jgi:hypothetical protein
VFIVGITFFVGNNEVITTPKAVEVEVYEGKVLASNANVQKTITPGEVFSVSTPAAEQESTIKEQKAVIISASDEIASSTAFEETLLQLQSQSPRVQILITDALGDPIPAGVIELNQEKYPFKNGRVSIQNATTGSFPITASADGYFPLSKTVNVDDGTEMELEMEYTCSFEIEVYLDKERTQPASNAEVTLYRSEEAERPVPETSRLYYNYVNVDFEDATVQYRQDGIHILQTSEKKLRFPPLNNRSGLQVGDVILGIDTCMWNAGDHRQIVEPNRSFNLPISQLPSKRLRIWDTVLLYRAQAGKAGFGPVMEFVRENQRHYCQMRKMNFSARDSVDAAKYTDAQGKCSFEDVKPGLYFVRAEKGEYRSFYIPLYPIIGGSKLRMGDSSMVRIHVTRKTNEGADVVFNMIEGANVVLQSAAGASQKGIFAKKTEKYGWISFENVPFGTYQITVTPPEKMNGQAVQQELDVNEPYHNVTIEIPGTGNTIRGQLLTYKDRQPVADYLLDLKYCGVTIPGDTGWGIDDAGEFRTDASGGFEFNNLKLGTYFIGVRSEETANYYPAFIPEDQRSQTGYQYVENQDYPRSSYMIEMAKMDIKDQDFENLVLFVEPSQKTTIGGIVTDENNLPIPDAHIQVKSIALIDPEKTITDSQGRFEFSFDGRLSNRSQSLTVMALKGKVIPEQWSNNSIEREKIEIEAQAEKQITFKIGDQINDMRLILEGIKNFTVYGTVKMEDGTVPKHGNVTVFQNNREKEARLKDDGSFEVHGVQPGQFTVTVMDEYHHIHNERFGEQPYYDYVYAYKSLEMPEDGEMELVELIVKPAGHLAGIVLDQDNQPYPDVVLQPKDDERSYHDMRSQQNGFFWLYGLEVGKPFSIHAFLPGEKEPAVIMEKLIPPNESIIIRIE